MTSSARAHAQALLRRCADLVAAVESGRSDALDQEAIGTCTLTAAWLAEAGGGAVMGYWATDNPAAEIGAIEGGHDFALLAGRFIVDWWATEYAATSLPHPGVLDLDDPADTERVSRFYGPRGAWSLRRAM